MGQGSKARASNRSNNRSSSNQPPSSEFDPGYTPNLKRSLSRNDVELAALYKLHVALRTLKEAIVNEFGDDVLVHCVLNEKNALLPHGADGSNVKNADDTTNNEDGTPDIISQLDEDQKQRLHQLSTAFLLRMKLRRRLLNRLARRLHRVAHVLDGGTNITPPPPPQIGDVVRRYITTEGEKSGLALKIMGGTFDDVHIVREGEVKKFINKEDERKEIRTTLDEQRKIRLGLEKKGDDKEESDDEEKDDSMNIDEEDKEDGETKSEVDILLQGDEEDKPLLDQLVEYEVGYDKIYSFGPPPLPPAVASSSPSKKSKKKQAATTTGGKMDGDKAVPTSPSATATAAEESKETPSKKDAADEGTKENQLNVTMPIVSTIDDHEVDEEGEFLSSKTGNKTRLPYSLNSYSNMSAERSLHPMDRATEWKRWTKEMLDKIPEQVTFDELGVGGVGMVFDMEERMKRKQTLTAPDNRGKGKVLKRSSPEKSKTDDDDVKDKDGDVDMGDVAVDSSKSKSDEKDNKKAEESDPKASSKTFSMTPIPSFHYQDLKRIKILQQNLVGSRNAQAQREIMEEANLKYEKAYSLSIKLQSEKVEIEKKLRTVQLDYKNGAIALQHASRLQLHESQCHWQKRQYKLKLMRQELGEEQTFNKQVCNNMLQDLKDRVCIRSGESALGSAKMKKVALDAESTGDLNRSASATVLGHLIDSVERRHKDMLADHNEFIPPIQSSPANAICNVETGETMKQVYKRRMAKLQAEYEQVQVDFKDAEKRRGETWVALSKAKTDAASGGRTASSSKPRVRKSTGGAHVTRQSYPTQQQVQANPGYSQNSYAQVQYQQQIARHAQAQQQQASQMQLQQQVQAQMAAGMMQQRPQFVNPQQMAQYQQQMMAAQQQQQQQQRQVQPPSGAQFYPVAQNNVQPTAASAGAARQDEPSTADGEPRKQTQAERYGYGDKYSTKNVNARKNADGTVVPASAPKLMADGKFARPSGRQRKGFDWDYERGVWVPIPGWQQDIPGGGSSRGSVGGSNEEN